MNKMFLTWFPSVNYSVDDIYRICVELILMEFYIQNSDENISISLIWQMEDGTDGKFEFSEFFINEVYN